MERWARINAAAPSEAREQLRICCGSSRWIDRMMERRPFASRETACAAAREAWFGLGPADWLEAFEHHPRIGESRPAEGTEGTGAGLKSWATGDTKEGDAPISPVAQDFSPASASSEISAREQAGVAAAGADVKQALAEGNREYEARFGHIYLVCATGKSADELLAILRARLKNDPAIEIRVAAEEHAKICDLRLRASA